MSSQFKFMDSAIRHAPVVLGSSVIAAGTGYLVGKKLQEPRESDEEKARDSFITNASAEGSGMVAGTLMTKILLRKRHV